MTIIGTVSGLETDPIQAILNTTEEGVLALVAGVEDPFYRPVGLQWLSSVTTGVWVHYRRAASKPTSPCKR